MTSPLLTWEPMITIYNRRWDTRYITISPQHIAIDAYHLALLWYFILRPSLHHWSVSSFVKLVCPLQLETLKLYAGQYTTNTPHNSATQQVANQTTHCHQSSHGSASCCSKIAKLTLVFDGTESGKNLTAMQIVTQVIINKHLSISIARHYGQLWRMKCDMRVLNSHGLLWADTNAFWSLTIRTKVIVETNRRSDYIARLSIFIRETLASLTSMTSSNTPIQRENDRRRKRRRRRIRSRRRRK